MPNSRQHGTTKLLATLRRRLGSVRAYFRRLTSALLGPLPDDWESTEIRTSRQMIRPLSEYRRLLLNLDNLAFDLLRSVRSLRQPQPLFGAHINLLGRVLHDLRVTTLAAERGYTMQAWTIAASCFEAAHTMGYLAVDPKRADAWWAHTDTEHTFCPAKTAVEGSFKYLEVGDQGSERDAAAQHEYALYQRLCLAKHVNPVAERTRYITKRGSQTVLVVTPFFSDRRAREARLGLILAARSATLALWVFHKCHLRDGDADDNRIVTLASETARLLDGWRDIDR